MELPPQVQEKFPVIVLMHDANWFFADMRQLLHVQVLLPPLIHAFLL